MKLTDVIKIWDVLHVKDVGELGYCDLEKAVEDIVGIENDVPGCPPNKANPSNPHCLLCNDTGQHLVDCPLCDKSNPSSEAADHCAFCKPLCFKDRDCDHTKCMYYPPPV